MKNRLKDLASLLIILIIQVSVINQMIYKFVPINLLLIYSIYNTERKGYNNTYLYVLTLGLMYDMILSTNMGIETLMLYIVTIFIGIIREYLFLDTYSVDVFYGMIGTSLYILVGKLVSYMYALPYNISIKDYILTVLATIAILVFIRVYERKKPLNIEVGCIEK